MKIVITENRIKFLQYSFNNIFCKQRIVYENEINFVKIDEDIISLCINLQEILFIPLLYKEQVEQFIKHFGIQKSQNQDVWKLICYPFVDSYRTEEEFAENMRQLKDLSFEQEEVEGIRKKISIFMKWFVVFSMEHEALGHSEVLQARKNIYFLNPFYSNFYWYTMNIALKGFGIKVKT